MQSNSESILSHSYDILVYKRTDEFPKPGLLILADASSIEEHVKEVENNRDIYAKQMNRISTKFAPLQGSGQFFYSNDVEQKYNVETKIALHVESLVDGTKKGEFFAKCYLACLIFPPDVDNEDKYIYIDVQHAEVVQPVVCTADWSFIDTPPDNKDVFGLQTAKNVWHVYNRKKNVNFPMLNNFVIEYGLKEYSRIMTYVPPAPQTQADIAKEAKQVTEEQEMIDAGAKMIHDYFLQHPLARFVNHLYEHVLHTMNEHKIATSEEFRKELEMKFKITTNSSDMSVSFDDSDIV